MPVKKNIVAICGSTRRQSSNFFLIRAIEELGKDFFDLRLFDLIGELPQFNPDMDNESPPILVADFRKLLHEADGILICTPEYAMGVPGSLKNAIDWTVSSMEFSQKPTALITASLSGVKAHASLMETLLVIEAKIPDETQLIISFIKTKVNEAGVITDEKTKAGVQKLLEAFYRLMV
jgi:NAD(P)H-dependent FMN reductase